MKTVYTQPQAELVFFGSSKAIALNPPSWGWTDEDIFGESGPEVKTPQDDSTEG